MMNCPVQWVSEASAGVLAGDAPATAHLAFSRRCSRWPLSARGAFSTSANRQAIFRVEFPIITAETGLLAKRLPVSTVSSFP